MDGRAAPLWLIPDAEEPLPEVRKERFGLGVILGVASLVAAVPAYVFLAPPSVWEPESLLVVLLILSSVSYSAAVQVRGSATLDASFIAALVAVVFLGPLPAACIYALPEINGWFARRRIISLLGNTASGFWGTWAAAWTLEALTSGVPLDPALGDLPAIAIAGAVLLGLTFLVSVTLVCVIWEGHDFRPLVQQDVAELAPASLLMLAVGTGTVLLYEELGLAGLVPLGLLVLLPRALVPLLSQSRDPAKLDRTAAIALYARVIAQGLDLDAAQKRVLADAATHLGDTKRLTRIEDFDRVMRTVLYCRERWDGDGGFPGVLSGEAIPLESRVLAVAEQLGTMTAAGTRALPPEQAIAALVVRAGTEFDPRVVSAARWAIEKGVLVPRPPRTKRAPATPCGLELESTSRSNPLHTKPTSREASSARSAPGFCDHQVARASAPPAMISASCSRPARSRSELAARGSTASRSARWPVARARSSR